MVWLIMLFVKWRLLASPTDYYSYVRIVVAWAGPDMFLILGVWWLGFSHLSCFYLKLNLPVLLCEFYVKELGFPNGIFVGSIGMKGGLVLL